MRAVSQVETKTATPALGTPRLRELMSVLGCADNGVASLRASIFGLACSGDLETQDERDEPVDLLLRKLGIKPLPDSEAGQLQRLPNGWRWVRLGDLAEYGAGNRVDGSEVPPNAWLVELEDIEPRTSRLLARIRAKERNPKSDKTRFKAGDVLYGKLRPNLDKVLVASEPGYCTPEIVVVRGRGATNPEYLRAALKSPAFVAHAGARVYGMNLPRLGSEDASDTPIPIPPLKEQSRIAALVSRLVIQCDEWEARRREEREAAESVMRASLRALTSTGTPAEFASAWNRVRRHSGALCEDVGSVEALRDAILDVAMAGRLVEPQQAIGSQFPTVRRFDLPPGSVRGVKRVKQTPIDEPPDDRRRVPRHWSIATVQELYDNNMIVDFADGNHGELYPRASDFGDAGVPFVTARNIEDGRVDLEGCPRLRESKAKQLRKGWAQGGDVLLTHNATVGRVGTVPLSAGKFLLGTSVTFYRLNPNALDASFFLYFLMSPRWQRQLQHVMEQTTRNQVSIQKQALLSVAVPPVAEQVAIAARVTALLKWCGQLKLLLAQRDQHAVRVGDSIVTLTASRTGLPALEG